MNVLRSGIVLGLLGLVLAGCTASLPPDPNRVAAVGDLVAVFDRLALGLGQDGNAKGQALKWVTPIKIELQDAQSESDRTTVRKAFDVVTKLTGIPYEFVEMDQESNFFVRFVDSKDVFVEVAKLRGGVENTRGLPPQAICYAHPIGQNSIVRAHILIAHDMGRAVRDICVLHEMMHAFGLIGHHRRFFPSILYHTDMSRQGFSVNDAIVLRVLYDSKISAGMKRGDALPVANSLIKDIVQRISATQAPDTILQQPLKW